MQHVAEIAVHQFLEKVASGEASFSEKTAKRVADDVKDAVKRQFSSDRKKDCIFLYTSCYYQKVHIVDTVLSLSSENVSKPFDT